MVKLAPTRPVETCGQRGVHSRDTKSLRANSFPYLAADADVEENFGVGHLCTEHTMSTAVRAQEQQRPQTEVGRRNDHKDRRRELSQTTRQERAYSSPRESQ
jgi:hypothetical protein